MDETPMEQSKARKNFVILGLLLLSVFAALMLLPSITQPSSAVVNATREDVLARLAAKGVWAVGEPAITRLSGVEELKKTKHIIYGNAKDGQYEIRWPSLLVIYDYENDAIVNSLSITQVRLPEPTK